MKLVRMKLSRTMQEVISPWKVHEKCNDCKGRVPFPLLWRGRLSHGQMTLPSCVACLAEAYLRDCWQHSENGEAKQ